jgi:hypothetical protein
VATGGAGGNASQLTSTDDATTAGAGGAPMTPVGAILPATRLQQWGAIAKSTTSIVGAVSLLAMAGIFLASYRDLPARTKRTTTASRRSGAASTASGARCAT